MDNIDFSRLKEKLLKNGITLKEMSNRTGIGYSTMEQFIYGMSLPRTDKLMKLCAELRCSANDIVEFKGFEPSKRYETHRTDYYPPVYGRLTYEPLRRLFLGFYGEKWKSKLTEFYGTLSHKVTEKQLRAAEKVVPVMTGKDIKVSQDLERAGLTPRVRRNLDNDRPVDIKILYDICKALKCTPDYVIDYI